MFRSILMLIALIVLARPALADECNSRVYDTTGKVTDIAGIESTLKSIVGDGADPTLVRIISTSQMNEIGNLDKYAGSMLKRCPSWQSAGGGLKSNIFLMVVEPGGTIAILFNKKGPFQNVLGGKTQTIRNEMGGLLAKGDIAGSVKAGLILTHSLLSAPAPKIDDKPRALAPVVASGPVTIVNHNEKPADLSGLWTFMKWLLFLGVVGAGVWLFLQYKSKKSKQAAAQQRAQNARGACTNLISGFETRLTTLSVLMGPLKAAISATEYAAFQSRVSDLKASMDSAKNQFATSSGSSNDPESVGLSVDAYDSMTTTFERVQANLERVDAAANTIESSLRGVGRLRDSAQPAIDELGREIEKATTTINSENTLKVDGPRATLKLAIDALEKAEEQLSDKSYQAVLDTCKGGVAQALKAAKEVKGLASRKRDIENTISRVEATEVSGALATVDSVISTTRQTYGEGSVASAPGHRATISQKISERRIAIAAAKSAVTLQDWNQAEQQAETARKATSAITSAVDAINDLGPAILRQRRADEEAARRASYRPQPSVHSHQTHQVTHVHHHVTRDDEGPGFGTGVALGALGALAVDSLLDSRREERSSFRSRSNDDDGGSIFGGDSGRAADPDPSPWCGDSGRSDPDPPSSPSNDFNSSND